ncbi:MAG: hypothetical protein JST00_00600 [Deltaproteobacteria bacterium]|nr:hypothetical protein [Deltaproteobacteria bacterium]
MHHTNPRSALVRRLAPVAAAAAVASFLAGCSAEAEAPDSASSEEQSEAFTSFPSVPSDFPKDSDWALAMITRACRLGGDALDGASGRITRATGNEGGVVYEATRGSRVVASAWARSTFIGAEKRCLTK